MNKISRINPYRIVFQMLVIAFIFFMIIRLYTDKTYTADFEAYCPFGGLLAFSGFLVNNSLACSMTSAQIAMGGVLFLAIILFSKLFCSYICPVGTVSEWIGKTGEKIVLRFAITGYADILLRGIKYGFLFVIIYFTVTSSELFCRKIDPYYASVTGFNTDVSMTWAIIAIVVVVAGSFFIRLFWCKYICPLGAVSNIFRFLITFIVVTGAYVGILSSGIKLSFIWPVALLCCIAYMYEFFSLKSDIFPIFKIKRDTALCTNCKLCSKSCPQAIDVASLKVVKHIDCNLCADCIHVCPEKGALKINRNGKKWLPAAVLTIMTLAGFVAGQSFEIPTLSLYWGEPSARENMNTFSRSGLKSVKCFGSSTAFSNQMKKVKGVTGVTTFVKTNTVRILYNPSETDTISIMRSIFSPVKINIKKPGTEVRSLAIYRLRVENFLDPLDAVYLKQLLSVEKDVYGFTTEFDCPVRMSIFLDSSSVIDEDMLKQIVEKRELELPQADGRKLKINLKYNVTSLEKEALPVTVSGYLAGMYYTYLKNYRTDTPEIFSTYSLLFPGGGTEATNSMLEKLSYHLSVQEGIMAIRSEMYNSRPMLVIYFDRNLTTDKLIHETLNSAIILSPGPDGSINKIENPLSFPFKGETVLH